MGKPSFKVYEQFRERYARINEKLGRKQYLCLLYTSPVRRTEPSLCRMTSRSFSLCTV